MAFAHATVHQASDQNDADRRRESGESNDADAESKQLISPLLDIPRVVYSSTQIIDFRP